MRAHLFVAAGMALSTVALAQKLPPPPQTPKKPVTDVYHGVKVEDPYRWLENWDDPAVKQWSQTQNAYARAYLDKLPHVDDIRQRITELRANANPSYEMLVCKGHTLFAMKSQPPKQQPMLVTLALDPSKPGMIDLGSEKLLVDPNAIDAKGLTAIDFYVPSLDGKLVAVSMSQGGSESGDVHVFEVATGKALGDVVPRVNGGTAGGSLAWNADNSGFFYTRYPRGNERPPEDMDFYQQVYQHKLGQPTGSDTYEIGKEFPRIAEVVLSTRDDGKYTTASVAKGDGGDFEHFVRMPDGQWRKFGAYEDRIVRTAFGPMDMLYLISLVKSPRGELLQIPLFDPQMANVERVVHEQPSVMEEVLWAGDHIFLQELAGGPSQLEVFDIRGAGESFIPVLPVSTVNQMVKVGDQDILFSNQSLLSPPAWYYASATNTDPVKTTLAKKSDVDFSDCEVLRENATSKDGTKIPIMILRPKGTKLDGSNPTLLWGYGGYSISEQPTFSEIRKVWAEQGGVFAIANIRGGGEFGEEWHSAGNLTHKQNVFDDFYAAMEQLKKDGYCTTGKLAIYGGSNGGLLMGAMITQHPGACRAVVSAVGIYDMLRVELSPNGAFNVTEFGTVKNEEQFKAMYDYSPYHHVQEGTKYPAILMMTGANDPRVDPMQSRKMIARLQASTTSGLPVLLRTSMTSGHGIGSSLSERIEQDVDRYAFLFHELGVDYKPVKQSKN